MIRLWASLLDAVLIALPITILAGLMTGNFEDEPISKFLLALYTLLLPVIWNGRTVGKKISGIRIQKYDTEEAPGIGTMLLRNVVSGVIYGLTLGIGAIISAFMVIFREDKRALHDFIAGTEVIYD
ncbi:RDD family protein [Paenibacillus lemnae]